MTSRADSITKHTHCSDRFYFLVVALLGLPLLTSQSVTGQWLDFSDETTARLMLQPFADDPSADPGLDEQEKDIAVADLDRDGDDDIIVVRKFPFSFAGARQDVLLMNEGGMLVDRTATLAPGFLATLTDARDLFVGDFTGDGWDDLVIANTFEQQPSFYRNRGNDAGGSWLGLIDESSLRLPFLAVPGDVSTIQICAVWGGDVTGNQALDIYLSNYRKSVGTTDLLLINDGNGFFSNQTAARLGEYANVAFGTSVEIHDMDADGDNDIVKISTLYDVDPFDEGQYILFNDGSGTFDTIPYQSLPAPEPYMFAIGDLNGDGKLDQLLQGDDEDSTLIATGITPQGEIEYAASEIDSARTLSFGGNTKLGDVDGDGDLDGGIAPIDVDVENCGFPGSFALLENQGGTMIDPYGVDQNFHIQPHDFGFVDIDSDGCLDLFMGLCTGWAVFIQEDCEAQAGPELEISGSCPGTVEVQVDGLTPGALVGFLSGTEPGITIAPGGSCAGTEMGIQNGSALAVLPADANGEITLTPNIPGGSCGALVQTIDLASCETSAVVPIL